MTNVYFSENLDNKFLSKLKSELFSTFEGCKKIAVKIHFGEPGNATAFTPEDIASVTKILEDLSIEYFLYDSSVMYGGKRGKPDTHREYALRKGFMNVELGDEFIDVKGNHLTYQVCKKLTDADGVLVLTHVKGHVCSGFGGAIKNLGMGALTKKTKTDIHTGGMPLFHGKCERCAKCVEMCPINGLVLEEGEEYPTVKKCFGCSNCAYECPHGVISTRVAPFDILLAEGAKAAQSKFKKYYYVSALRNITQKCDCESKPGNIIAKDSGWIMSEDAVGIDQAALDLISKKSGEVFLKANKKVGTEQILAAERLDMGKKEYVLRNCEP
jgi:uncharacterized protein